MCVAQHVNNQTPHCKALTTTAPVTQGEEGLVPAISHTLSARLSQRTRMLHPAEGRKSAQAVQLAASIACNIRSIQPTFYSHCLPTHDCVQRAEVRRVHMQHSDPFQPRQSSISCPVETWCCIAIFAITANCYADQCSSAVNSGMPPRILVNQSPYSSAVVG